MASESTDGKKVDLKRFSAIVEAYGASPSTWPEDEREQAVALLEVSDEAVRLRDEAATLDGLLGAPSTLEPSDALRRRILAASPGSARTQHTGWSRLLDALWPFGPGWQPATALVMAAALGMTLGLLIPDFSPAAPETAVVSEIALDMGEDWSEAP